VAAVTPTENRPRFVRVSVAAAVTAAALAILVAGCGGGSAGDPTQAQERQELTAYVTAIEPLRLSVNKLLNGSDPILAGFRRHELTATQAQRGMRTIERRFARYMTEVAAVKPVPPILAAAQRAYAHTYVQEDAYLRALVAALPTRRWDGLPHTESEQRRVLVAWRRALALQAARLHVPLPADIQIVGLGEIAPSPSGS
jgi:hypothetical protein